MRLWSSENQNAQSLCWLHTYLYCCLPNFLSHKNIHCAWRGAGVAQLWERLPSINVSQVRFPDPASYVGWVCCWFSPLLRGFFSGFSGFPPSSKTNISKFQFDGEFECHGFISWRPLCATLIKQLRCRNHRFSKLWGLQCWANGPQLTRGLFSWATIA